MVVHTVCCGQQKFEPLVSSQGDTSAPRGLKHGVPVRVIYSIRAICLANLADTFLRKEQIHKLKNHGEFSPLNLFAHPAA